MNLPLEYIQSFIITVSVQSAHTVWLYVKKHTYKQFYNKHTKIKHSSTNIKVLLLVAASFISITEVFLMSVSWFVISWKILSSVNQWWAVDGNHKCRNVVSVLHHVAERQHCTQSSFTLCYSPLGKISLSTDNSRVFLDPRSTNMAEVSLVTVWS